MPSYTQPTRVTYTRTVAGATTATWSVAPPKGCSQCRVADIQASVTTAFVGTTTPAILGVGVANNVNALGSINFGTAATPSPVNSTVGFGVQYNKGTNPIVGSLDLSGTANPASQAALLALGTTPEVAGPILITLTASTGGVPAGAATAEITLDWF